MTNGRRTFVRRSLNFHPDSELRSFCDIYAEIAAVLELSTSSVESLLFRARRGLEAKLRRVNFGELPQDSRVSSAN